jgi:hypothetical protein
MRKSPVHGVGSLFPDVGYPGGLWVHSSITLLGQLRGERTSCRTFAQKRSPKKMLKKEEKKAAEQG